MNDQKLAAQRADETSSETLACLQEALRILPPVHRVVDVGCASGTLPTWLAIVGGYSAIGLDLHVTPKVEPNLNLIKWDLRRPIPRRMRILGELVLCWEVAEHLPESAAYTLCDSLARVTIPGGTLLFSAATPGQGGDGHVNEQSHYYWNDKLEDVGFEVAPFLTDELRSAFARVAPTNWWYSKNITAFTRKESR